MKRTVNARAKSIDVTNLVTHIIINATVDTLIGRF